MKNLTANADAQVAKAKFPELPQDEIGKKLQGLLTEEELDDDQLAHSLIKYMKRGYDLCLQDNKKAVNMHDELIEVLKESHKILEELKDDRNYSIVLELEFKIEQLLKQAEQK